MPMICDSHVHVVADEALHPQVADRTYTAGPAPLQALQAAAAPHGVTRFVVVQPSFYGTDNTVTLAALATLGAHGRGVAVIDPAAVTPASLAALAHGGIAGLRINLYSTLAEQRGGELEAAFAQHEAVAARMGWHVEVIMAATRLAGAAGLLAAARVPVVLDHYGLHTGVLPGSAEGQALLALLRRPHVWMKLSAPYRSSPDPLATRPDPAWAAALLAAAPGRCVWGSDWPHTAPHGQQTGGGLPLPYRALDYGHVLAGARAAMPPALADAVLIHNPARLYGFAP